MTLSSLLTIVTAICCFFFAVGEFHPEVKTELGRIRGTQKWFQRKAINVFLGVPYAQPPIGDLRFRKPQPITKYMDIVNATKMPPACFQATYTLIPLPWDDTEPGQSEDCLYLNIWTPAPSFHRSDKKKAVMYWIHGGGFTSGSIRDPIHDALALAAVGDVVVVVVAYRLSSLGSMYSATDDAPGNVALRDMVQGLRWVKQNIEAFGGNKNLITVFGESTGATAGGALTISPLSKGLFHRVILESGSPVTALIQGDSLARNFSQKIAEQFLCSNETYLLSEHPKEVIECLRGIDAEKLQYTAMHLPPFGVTAFFPITGDEVLPKVPTVAIRDLEFPSTNVLASIVRDEGSVFLILQSLESKLGSRGEKNASITKSQATEILRSLLPFASNFDEVVDHYLGGVEETDFEAIKKQAYTAIGDILITCPTLFFAEKFALKSNSYFAVFEHRSSTSPWAKWMGVAHYTEVEFVFGQPLLHPNTFKQGERRLSWAMIKMWTNFAKIGRPAWRWPKFSKKHPYYRRLRLTGGPIYGKYPDNHNCDLFRPHGF